MQTIEEAAHRAFLTKLKQQFGLFSKTEIDPSDFTIAFKAGVEFAQRWIDVDIEIADLGLTVIFQFVHVKYPKKMIHSTGYFDEKGVPILDYDIADCNDYDVTHWRPINLI